MKRSAIRKDTPGALAWRRKPRKPIRRESPKGRERRMDWQRKRDEHKERFPWCQGYAHGVPNPICAGEIQVHHVMPRSAGGTRGPHGPLLSLCARHHRWVEDNRAAAKELGLLIRRNPA